MNRAPILRAGDLELALLPQVGGSIGRFDRIARGERRALMRGTDEAVSDVLSAACFPLVPFCNRIRGGAFACDGRTIRLTPNMPPDPSPLHGQGWLAEWSVLSSREDEARLSFRHEPGEWPWTYEATQQFELDPHGLSIELACRNLSASRMPCGLGLHPYFPCDGQTTLDTRVDCAWTIDADVLPMGQVPATGRYELRRRKVCAQGLDNGFGGWKGQAQITWADGSQLSFASDDARYFQLYSPPEGGLFVAEPVQHANAALNAPQEEWDSLGIRLLEPGETRRLRVRFDVS